MNHRLAWILCLFVALCAIGCGKSGPASSHVTGTVTLDGQPVEQGEVLFRPSEGGGTPYACPIAAGKFEGDVAPGAKRVEINATGDTGKTAPDGMPEYKNLIPAKYNTETTLTADIADGSNDPLTFDLTSDGK